MTLTMNDVDITLTEIRLVEFGFAVDGSNAIEDAERLFGKADIYATDASHLLSAYWFVL